MKEVSSYLSIAQLQQRRVARGFQQFVVEEFAVGEVPAWCHGERHGSAARVVCEDGVFDSLREDRAKLHATKREGRQLQTQNIIVWNFLNGV